MSDSNLETGTWVTYVGGRAAGVRVRRCRLEVLAGPDAGLVRDLDASVIRIGARRGNDVQLSDSKVSGLHCEISLEERGYRLRDLDSTNGTYVAGMRVNDVFIAPLTSLALGDTKLRFEPLDESVEMPLSMRDRFGKMVGRSVKMRELFARLDKLAKSDATVLITGETGVGKELVAESLHEYSERADGPFEVLDCSSIPANLIESQLFGHERGAFTGATRARSGVFERADKGTVFLDEIGELPLDMQPKLLRVLESREVRRVMSDRTIPVDIRVVAATNRDLGVEVNRGRFREDLYYRLVVARVQVPPLRERIEDIPLLVDHILAQTPDGDSHYLDPEAIEMMQRYDWPGNVRELRNVIERAILLEEGPASQHEFRDTPDGDSDSPADDRRSEVAGASGNNNDSGEADEGWLRIRVDTGTHFKTAKQALIHEFETRYISRLLEEHEGNVSQAARAAGLERMSLHKIIKRLGLHNLGRE